LARQKPGALTALAPVQNGKRRHPGMPMSPSGVGKTGDSAASALYRAVTLSSVAHENLGKVLRPCLHASGNSEVVMKSILWSLPIILCLMTSAPCGSIPTN
jgi:hypothetical protein